MKIAPETFYTWLLQILCKISDSEQDERKKSLFIFFFAFTSCCWQYLADCFSLVRPDQADTCIILQTWVTDSTCFSTTKHYKTGVLTSLWTTTWITFALGHERQCDIRDLLKQTACIFHASLSDHLPRLLRALLPAHALANHSSDVGTLYKEPVENYLLYIFRKSHSLITDFQARAAHGSRRSQGCGWCGVRGFYGFGRGEQECNSPTWGQLKSL